METFLDTMLSYGFDDEAAVSAYRSLTTFQLGQFLLEVSAPRPVNRTGMEAKSPARDLTDYTHLQRLQPRLSQDHSSAEFEDALESLLDRLEHLHH